MLWRICEVGISLHKKAISIVQSAKLLSQLINNCKTMLDASLSWIYLWHVNFTDVDVNALKKWWRFCVSKVSATVTRTVEEESTIGRSCAETLLQVEPSTKLTRSSDFQTDVRSTLARSCAETSTSTKLLRLDFGDSSGSTLAKSCGNTTIQTSTKNAPSRRSDSKDTRDARDSGSEGHMTLERDLGSTLRLTPQHPTLYKPDRVRYL